jgi:DNA (cytosine-5)-methyltransferase 1
MIAVSLFSSGGIGELLLKELGIDVVCANELIAKRAEFYREIHGDHVITGDIRDDSVARQIKAACTKYNPDLLIATPPCQGFSTLGKNKSNDDFLLDERNYLIFEIISLIKSQKFKFILIENVARFLDLKMPHNGEVLEIVDVIKEELGAVYSIQYEVLNAKNHFVPQTRPRSFIKLVHKDFHFVKWEWPSEQPEINLRQSIGNLPSLESGEKSNHHPLHYAKQHNDRDILAMKHTPEGKSAMKNPTYFPKRKDGKRISGFHNTYKRMSWDHPAHARTTNSGNIGSHNNVHPGRKLKDGTYSDARALTLLETFIVTGIPEDLKIPVWASDAFIRTLIGEAVPPPLMREVLKPLINELK